ncbi:MAG TPA: hypothetical protein VJZ75_04645 [Candidatus Bathyarchaeia archaeon]|nr:hypothetical protein [Candidatus Bathyarchaeia archaeon]
MNRTSFMRTLTTVILLFVTGITILTVYGNVLVHAQTTIVAPVLTKSVTLDGRMTGDEWSDTAPVTLALYARTGPSERMNATIWAKHDDQWVYFMFRLSRFSADNPLDACGIIYHWGPGPIGSKGKPSDFATVNKRGSPEESYGWDGTRWYHDVNGTNNIEGALNQNGEYAWCEFRKKLNSGGGHGWSLSVGNTYGETENMFAVAFDATTQKTYTERIALSLLSTTRTNTRSSTNTLSSTTLSSTSLFAGLDTTRLMQVAGAIGTGGSVVIGWLFKTRKRRLMSNYLTRIDSTFNEYSLNQEDCKNRLAKMKDEVSHLLKKGQIDEAQFILLENKITQYMKSIPSENTTPAGTSKSA